MAIEKPEGCFCKVIHHENGRVVTRRIHEMVVQAVDGRTYRISGKGLPDCIDLYTGKLEDGKHFADVLLDPRLPRPRFFAFIQKPKIRDVFYMWLGASLVTLIALILVTFAANHLK